MSRQVNRRGLRIIGLVIVAWLVLGPLLVLISPAQPAEGQGIPVQNRALAVAVDAQGKQWAAWEVDDGNDTDVYYSRWTGQVWLSPLALSADPAAMESSPGLVLATDGALWAAWSHSTGASHTSIWVSRWQGLDWSAPSQVPGTAEFGGRQPALGSMPNGGLWLAWVGHDGTNRGIFASHWDGAAWSAPQQVSSNESDPHAYDMHPSLATDSSGQAWLGWTSNEGLLSDEIHASHWNGTSWSPEQQVSNADDLPDAWPSVAVDAQGRPWIAWQGAATESGNFGRIYASRWDPSRSLWAAENLVSSPTSLAVEEQHPSLALDAQSQLHLAWAISGELTGIAHSTWDGKKWSAPTWTRSEEDVHAPAVVADEETWLLWLVQDGPEAAPLMLQPVQEVTESLPQTLPLQPSKISPLTTVIANRHLAHGDSITWGQYTDLNGQPAIPYPTVLEGLLDNHVAQSEVINWGKPGEKAHDYEAEGRIRVGVQTYTPQFVQILEGTNDLTWDGTPWGTAFAVRKLIQEVKYDAGVPGVQVIVATLTPRRDSINDLVPDTNRWIVDFARREHVPVADCWQAYMDYGPWQEFYLDHLHPGTIGLRIIAETFYTAMIEAGMIVSDSTPPTAWITSLPPQSQCTAVYVAWAGDDGAGSGVASYDVQVQDGVNPWIDWLVATPNSSGTYVNAPYGHTLRFRVRARDQVGNVGAYSLSAQTQIIDTTPPGIATLQPLPPAQKSPFQVRWAGSDACSPVTFDVDYRVGSSQTWIPWLSSTPNTEGSFVPPAPPDYGKAYYFRARAWDAAGNLGAWSAPTSTLLAQFTLSGDLVTVRHEPIALASVLVTDSLAVDQLVGGGYRAYVAQPAAYDLKAGRYGFGALPAMRDVPVSSDLSGLDFVLPPLDDIVDDGGFEAGVWGSWQPGGPPNPTLITQPHTGSGAVRLGGGGGTSTLRQSFTVPNTLKNATVSFLVRLDNEAGGGSTLMVALQGTSISHTQAVSPGGWHHVWFPVGEAVGKPVTLTFTVSNNPAVRLDEVSLGSAVSGGGWAFFPMMSRVSAP